MLLVDAANVVGSVPDGWWRDRAGAAARLVHRLRGLAGERQVLVVLEGAARAGAPEGEHAGVAVRHAPGSGDDLLAHLCGPGVELVTADRGLAAQARARGAHVSGPRALLTQVDQACGDEQGPERPGGDEDGPNQTGAARTAQDGPVLPVREPSRQPRGRRRDVSG